MRDISSYASGKSSNGGTKSHSIKETKVIHGQIKPLFGTPLSRTSIFGPAGGLVAQYLMNEGCGDLIHDSCGMNDGKMIGMAPMSPTSGWVPGPHGAALAFLGANGYVDCGNPISIKKITGALTIIAWINTRNSAVRQSIVHYSQTGFQFCISGNTQYKLAGYIWNVAPGWLESSKSISDNTLYQVAMTYDLAQGKLFINGTQDALAGWSGLNTSVNVGFGIGARTTPLDFYFNGLISSVSIYNRALSAQEIAYLYAFPWCMYDSPMSAWEYSQQNRNFDHYYRRLMAA